MHHIAIVIQTDRPDTTDLADDIRRLIEGHVGLTVDVDRNGRHYDARVEACFTDEQALYNIECGELIGLWDYDGEANNEGT